MDQCRFCRTNGLLADRPLFENDGFYVLGMLDPARQHGVMIVPHRHCETPFEISAADWAHLPTALEFAKRYLDPLTPDGFTIGWNVGSVAGQTVAHAHMHVIARFDGPGAGRGLHGALTALIASDQTSGG